VLAAVTLIYASQLLHLWPRLGLSSTVHGILGKTLHCQVGLGWRGSALVRHVGRKAGNRLPTHNLP